MKRPIRAILVAALRDALLESTDSNISIDDVTVQYNAGIDVIKNYQPLNYSPTGSDIIDQFVKFGLGSQTIHFVWNGNAAYKPLKLDDVTVKMSDNRIKSRIVLKDGVSITYHMDPAVMEQEIFENLIDWDASTLPEKSTLSAADFTFEYYGENVLGEEDGGISGGVPDWAPVAGGTVKLLTYPQMGAGENQKVRVSYSGNDEYRPCKNVEGTLTVNKAKVSVKVHSTSIYADEAKDKLGEGFVTTDPADKFDIYTIYGGMTSDVTTSVFVQLPERMTNGTIIMLIDKTLKDLDKKTLTEMMQQGTTVGELRKLLSDIVGKGDKLPQPVKDLFKKVGIDIDTLVKLNEALNKFPGLLDNVRVAFGTPDQAGISHVLEHMVFKGTDSRPKSAISQEVESAGGYLNAATSYDYTVYITDMPDRHWKLGMDVVRDMAFHPTLDPQELESEKNVIVAELQRGEDDPGSRMFKTLMANTLKGTPYDRPIIGYEKTIRALTTQNLRDYIAKYYQPQNMLLVVVGNVDPAEVLAEAEKMFAPYKNATPLSEVMPYEADRLPHAGQQAPRW